MSRLTISEKAARTGKLLWGFRHPRVAAALETFGFNEGVLGEGWDLVTKVNELYLARVAARPALGGPEIVGKVGEFENLWFPIVKTALARHYPAAAELVFLNLKRTEGKSSAYSVEVFVDRLGAMGKGEAPYGAEGPAAREYLRTRGLTDAVVEEVARELGARKVVADVKVEPFDAAALEKAEAEMWAFYREWSTIARAVITDGHLLRTLGFKKRTGGRTPKTPAVVVTSEQRLDGSAPAPQLPGE